jgi:hypothetical protein
MMTRPDGTGTHEPDPAIGEVYRAKEALHALYRTRGIDRASRALVNLVARCKASDLPELRTLARTLTRRMRHLPF